MKIPLYKSLYLVGWALVDPDDYEDLIRCLWRDNGAGYACRYEEGTGRGILMHRQLMGLTPGDKLVADHINGDPRDNRRANLRICTQAENLQNTGARRGSSSRFRGVCRRDDRWIAQAKIRGEVHYLGMYDSEEQAALVAAAFRAEHMPFATGERLRTDEEAV